MKKKMGEEVKESVKAIKEAEAKYVGNTFEFAYLVGMHLKKIGESGGNLAQLIRKEFSFSPERGYAFKRFYELSVTNRSVDVKTLGVDKALALIEPLKADGEDFLKDYPIEALKEMTVGEVRQLSRDYSRSRTGRIKLGKNEKAAAFFLQAEDKLRDVFASFQGISVRYKEEYFLWERKGRNLEIAKELNKTVEACLELSDKLLKVLEGLQ